MSRVLPIIFTVVVVACMVIYGVLLSSKVNRGRRETRDGEVESEERRRMSRKARVKLAFIDSKNITFLEALKAALPKSYIIYPRVAVELLFYRDQRADLQLKGQYVDFCVFTDRYVPILAIDLVDFSSVGESAGGLRKSTKEIIRNSGIEVLDYNMRDTYSTDDLRKAIAQTMNPLYGM